MNFDGISVTLPSKRFKLKTIIYSFLLISEIMITGCSIPSQLPAIVPKVDLLKYAGKWYEIAAFPNSFQKNCFCSTAEYTISDKGYVKIFNACRKGGFNGKISTITGKAFSLAGTNNTKLRVQFFWPFRADYWVIGLAEDYSYAMVSGPSRKYLWILGRKPQLDEITYQSVLAALRNNGFDLSRLKRTEQKCE